MSDNWYIKSKEKKANTFVHHVSCYYIEDNKLHWLFDTEVNSIKELTTRLCSGPSETADIIPDVVIISLPHGFSCLQRENNEWKSCKYIWGKNFLSSTPVNE